MNNNFTVFIRCSTYNHAPFIEDTMNGFVMQKTNFPYVCCILDDCSTDGEQEVIKKYLDDNFDFGENYMVSKEETDDYKLIGARHKFNRNCFFAVFFLKYNHYQQKKN